MRPSALAAFPAWLAHFEGNLPRPYLDVKGLPTVGLAFLVPLSTALGLAWTVPSRGGELATLDDVRAAYAALLALPPGRGGGWYQSRVDLALSPHSAAQLLVQDVASYETALRSSRHVGPAWDGLPGVCQMGRMRTSWAEGGEALWPKLDAALARGDWAAAQAECWPSDAGPDPEDPSTAGRKTTQPKEYAKSYLAVRQLYMAANDYPGDELPDPLPTGSQAEWEAGA